MVRIEAETRDGSHLEVAEYAQDYSYCTSSNDVLIKELVEAVARVSGAFNLNVKVVADED